MAPAAVIVQVKDASRPAGLAVTVQVPGPGRAPYDAVVVMDIVVPAVPDAGANIIAAAANARGRSPVEGRVIGGMAILGRVNGVKVTSGILISGICSVGAGTTKADMNKRIRYAKLARRIVKPITPSNCRVKGCSEMDLIMLLSLPHRRVYNFEAQNGLP